MALVAAVAWSLLCASPGLLGGWVYDDLLMSRSPAYDALDDVPRAFLRTSYDYQYARAATPGPVTSETYRPVTMATLIATHAVAPAPLPHHLLGWALHVLVTGLLFAWLRRVLRQREPSDRQGERVELAVAGWLALLFLLHPIGVEAYVWINGRSDVTAAVFLMASALLVEVDVSAPAAPASPLARVGWLVSASVLAFGALASKETAVIPLAALWLAALLRTPLPLGSRRSLVWPLAAGLLGVTLYFACWHAVRMGALGSLGAGSPALTDPSLVRFAPKLLAIATGALVSLRALPMQSYAWLALRPLTPLEWASALLLVIGLLALVRKRDWPGLALVVGALLALAPTLPLSHALWLGLDRYLYMPLLLVLAAAAPHGAALVTRSQARGQRLPRVLGAVVLVIASAGTAMASSFYADHATWQAAPRDVDPLEPTRYVLRAKDQLELHNTAAAHAELASMPPFPWPLPVLLGALDVALATGDEARYDAILAQAAAAAPEHVGVRFHQFHVALRRGQLAAALERVPALAATEWCADVALHLGVAAERYPVEARPALLAARERMACSPRPVGRTPR